MKDEHKEAIMKRLKLLLLGVLAVSSVAVFTTNASAADWRFDHRRAEINREYREAWRRREAFDRDHRFGWWNRDNRFDAWRNRYGWRDYDRWHR
jgi:hypothetical protein